MTNKMTTQNKEEIDILEDDEFEEFEEESKHFYFYFLDWNENEEEIIDTKEWEEDWDEVSRKFIK